MGKYIKRKAQARIAMTELSQSSLGVSTRAKAVSLPTQSGVCHTRRECESLKQACQSECKVSLDTYMELRSRRLEKVARCSTGRGDDAAQAARKLENCGRPFRARNFGRSPDEESRLQLSNTSSSRHGFSRPTSAEASDTSHTGPSQPSLQSSVKRSVRTGLIKRRFSPATSARSKNVSGSYCQGRSLGSPEFTSSTSQEGMDTDNNTACRIAKGPACENQLLEGEPFFGENSVAAGSRSRDSYVVCTPEKYRRSRDITPDSCNLDELAPGSTSRTRRPGRRQGRSFSAPPFARASDVPSTRDIEAFFECAEQQERRRFMERYNFDPVNDRPLRGRYEWSSK